MKKLLLVLLPLVLVTLLSATHLTPADLKSDLEITYGGDFVTRAIMNGFTRAENDTYNESKHNGGWFDNRLRFELNAKLGEKVGIAWKPQVGYNQFTGFGTDSGIKTRELYMDIAPGMMDSNIRMGRQYWCDHRSLILDDYFAGITADMKLMGFDAEFGYIKAYEGAVDVLDEQQAVFAGIAGKAPINWGATLMYGRDHGARTADIWIMPYAGIESGPINLDVTLVADQHSKNTGTSTDSKMGIGVAVKGGMDMGIKIGADILVITEDGLNGYSSYYENGLYIFGNKLAYDTAQEDLSPYQNGNSFISAVGTAALPLSEQMEVFGAVGLVSIGDIYAGVELNAGMNWKLMDAITFCPVIALGGSAFDEDTTNDDDDFLSKSHYLIGGLIKAEF